MSAAPDDLPPSGPIAEPDVLADGAVRPTEPGPDERSAHRARLTKAILVFTALRLGLIAVLTLALLPFVPLLIALALAIVLQLPLSMALFGRPRAELTEALALATAHRRAERAQLRAELRGRD